MCDASIIRQDGGFCREVVYYPVKIDHMISVLLSGIATGIVVVLLLIFKLYKRPLSRMVLAINIAHMLFYYSKFVLILFPPRSDKYCQILSIINVFGFESAAIWGCLFAHAFYLILKHQSFNEQYLPPMMNYYLIFAVLVPLANGFVSYLIHFLVYSEDKGTCVHLIYSNKIDISYLLSTVIPIGIACLLSIIWYKMLISKISGLRGAPTSSELYVFMIYPGILLFCWCPTLIVQISLQFGANLSDDVVKTVIFIVNSQGLLDALVYGRFLKDVLKESFSGCYRKYVLKSEETSASEPLSLEESVEQELTISSLSLLSEHNEPSVNRRYL